MAGAQEIVFDIDGSADGLIAAGEAGAKALRVTGKAAQDLTKQVARVTDAAADFQRKANAWAGVTDRVGRSAKTAASYFQKDWDSAIKQVDRMRTTLDPLYAASKKYEEVVARLDSAARKGAISDAERVRLLGLAEKAYLRVGDAVDVAAVRSGGFAGAMQRNGHSIQLVGYQVQDMAVQLAAGQNAMVVFAQQGSQIASAFGPMGVMIGTLAAVGLPLLGAAFARAGDQGDNTRDAIEGLTSGIDGYLSYVENATKTTSELGEEFGAWAEQIRQASEYLAGVQLAKVLDDLAAAVDPLKGQLSEVQGLFQSLTDAQSRFDELSASGDRTLEWTQLRDEIEAIDYNLTAAAEKLGLTRDQALSLAAAIDDIGRAKGMAEIATSAGRVLDLMRSIAASGYDLPPALRDAAISLEKIQAKAAQAVTETGRMPDILHRAREAMDALAAAAPGGGWLSGAISDAATLATTLWDAASAKAAAYAENAGPDERGSQRGQQQSAGAWRSQQAAADRARGGSGGGGGGGQNQLVSNLDSLRNSLMTEEQLEAESYARRQELLQAALAQRLITQQEFAALAEDAQRAHQEAMAEIDVWRYGDGQQKAAAFMGVLADTFQSGNERMQRMGRVFGAAEALINAWRAYNQTLADPSLPFMAKFAAAASVLSAGMKAVQAIKSGGGGSAGRSASPSAAAPVAARPNMTANYTITGDVIGRQTGGELIKSINDALRAGYQINLEWA